MTQLQWIEPDWPAPANVRAAATLRTGGVSRGPYASLNLGSHVGDDPEAVAENRRRLRAALQLPSEPVWLSQVHGVGVIEAQLNGAAPVANVETHLDGASPPADVEARLNSVPPPRSVEAQTHRVPPTADAAVAHHAGQVCVILTADCLPVLFCDRAGTRVAAAHAGWRGLAEGVLEATVSALKVSPDHLLAWLGPAIEPEAFEVGAEVREQFLARDSGNDFAFTANPHGRWQADLSALARRELRRLGVTSVYGGAFRCYGDSDRFFSYRRDSRTGRMATLVWRTR